MARHILEDGRDQLDPRSEVDPLHAAAEHALQNVVPVTTVATVATVVSSDSTGALPVDLTARRREKAIFGIDGDEAQWQLELLPVPRGGDEARASASDVNLPAGGFVAGLREDAKLRIALALGAVCDHNAQRREALLELLFDPSGKTLKPFTFIIFVVRQVMNT